MNPIFFQVFIQYRCHLHLVKIWLGSDHYKWPKMALEVARFRDDTDNLLGKLAKGLLITPAL